MPAPATPLADVLRDAIARNGPMPFSRFMQTALYHPEWGYYQQQPKPIGTQGDFFTASQLQPTFGRLMRQYCLRLRAEHAPHLPQSLLELGPGRGEMRAAFADFHYQSVEANQPLPAQPFTGILFANELFDALPVDAAVMRANGAHALLVNARHDGFVFAECPAPDEALTAYAQRYGVPGEDGFVFEAHLAGLDLLRRLCSQSAGTLMVFIDYGYTKREWRRFPQGTLMSYRRHRASAEVLENPGLQDITAHVPFHALVQTAEECGCRLLRQESMAQALLHAGEPDNFAAALEAHPGATEMALRQQLKLLLYGMGESFRVIALQHPAETPPPAGR